MEITQSLPKPLAQNFVEALTILKSQLLQPFFEEVTSLWSGFRENQLWTLEINSLYTNNMPQLQVLFKHYALEIDQAKRSLQ